MLAYVKLPFELKEALMLMRQNIPKIKARVSEGVDVQIEDF